MVVIMMGRKRSRHAWTLALAPLGVEGEVDHHDGVLLHDSDEQNNSDESDDG